MKQLRALAASAVTVLTFIAAGIPNSTTALASGDLSCVQLSGGIISCDGQLSNGIPITIVISTTPPLNLPQIDVVLNDLHNLLQQNPPPTAQQLANDIVQLLERLGIHTCTVNVSELGLVISGHCS